MTNTGAGDRNIGTAGLHGQVGEEDLGEIVSERLGSKAWSSGLSVSDFASCLSLGMEPAAFVQGFAVMQWAWYSTGLGMGGYSNLGYPALPSGKGVYSEQWNCPHGFVGGEHRMYGFNYEQTWVENNWKTGWDLAFNRMLDEAKSAGAHGVIGVVDEMHNLAGTGAAEFRIQGTAVRVPDSPLPPKPFTTFLSGQRLAKLLETGHVPVSVVASLSSVQMVASCMTHYQLSGNTPGWSSGTAGVASITQVNNAQIAVRQLAREHVRAKLGKDLLHGASTVQFEHEVGEGNFTLQCVLKGTRVRRFKKSAPLPEVRPVVRLT